MLQTCPGACIQAFGHICEVHSKEASGRQACLQNALVLVYKHLGACVHLLERTLWWNEQLRKCPGTCIQLFGLICEVYRKENSGRQARLTLNLTVQAFGCMCEAHTVVREILMEK